MTRDEAIKYVIDHWPENARFPLSKWDLRGEGSWHGLSQAFIWENTLEGRSFWIRLSKILDKKPVPEPEPELILPSIDWSVIKPEYKWLAQDKSGRLYVYTERPSSIYDQFGSAGGHWGVDALVSAKPGTGDWTKLIVERPEPLWYPDDSGKWVEHDPEKSCPVEPETYTEVLSISERNSQVYIRLIKRSEDFNWHDVVAYKAVKND